MNMKLYRLLALLVHKRNNVGLPLEAVEDARIRAFNPQGFVPLDASHDSPISANIVSVVRGRHFDYATARDGDGV